MNITFLYPGYLWLLILLPLAAALALGGARRPTPGRFWAGLALRLALMLLLIVAIAGIQLRLPVDKLTVVFVLDVSDSLSAEEQARGESFIRAALAEMPDSDEAAIILFGKDALVERLASPEGGLAELTSTPVRTRTDIAGALQLALALFPDEGARRIVLLSDGRANLGQALEQAELAALHDIELTYLALGSENSGVEVLVEGLQAPADVRQGQEIELGVTISSSAATGAELRLYAGQDLLETRQVSLQAGLNRFTFTVQAGEPGFRRFRVQVVPDADIRLQNNEASAFSVVNGPPQVLLVSSAAQDSQSLGAALESAGMQVHTISPQDLPGSLPELANFEAVVLVNVPAEALPAGSMETIQAYVRDLGKGLLMIGGDQSFGAGGYLRTALEETLPVDMDVRSRQESPDVALVLAVDKSGSMGRCHCDDPDLNQTYVRAEVGQPKVDIAKAAIMSAASALGPRDYLGVVAFDSVPRWALQLRQVVDAFDLEQSIGAIAAEGDTNLETGVAAAYLALQGQEARVKHVILLTDGWVHGGDLIALAQEMQEQGITLSVVAAGEGSAEYLEELALTGGGRYYPAGDILNVPEFFLKETITTVGRYIIEEAFYPLPVESANPVLRGLSAGELPALLGYNGATPKDTARVVLSTPQGDPLLSTWQYGLGRAAAWTSDLSGRWAAEWLEWDGFGRFAAQLVGWTLPAPQVEGLSASAEVRDDLAELQVSATGQDGQPRNFLEVEARLVGPDLESQSANLTQTGAGEYAASLDLAQPGVYLAQIQVRAGDEVVGQQTLGLVVPYSPEYRLSGNDRAYLDELAERTGGEALTDPEQVFTNPPLSAARAVETWPALLTLVALLFPLDVAIRRVVFGRADFERGWEWLADRLGLKRLPGAGAPRQPVLGQLFAARGRARQRTSQRQETPPAAPPVASPVKPPPAQPPPAESKPAGTPPASAPPQPDESSQDTFERLRQARQKRRGR